MLTTFAWVCFGMAAWGMCILMQALQRRFAPELGTVMGTDTDGVSRRPHHRKRRSSAADPRDQEIAELKARIEALETIVTDRRYQWEQDLRRS